MPVEPTLRVLVIDALVKTGISMFTQLAPAIRLKPRGDSLSAIPLPQDKPCSPCMIHQNVALAKSYIDGLSTRLNPDGSIPEGLGGTLRLAQDHISKAMDEIPQTMGIDPRLDQACMELGQILPKMYTSLALVQGQQEFDALVVQAEKAARLAYTIPEIVYRRDKSVALPQPKEAIEILPSEDRELLEVIRKTRRGDISIDEAKSQLESLLVPGDKKDDKPA